MSRGCSGVWVICVYVPEAGAEAWGRLTNLGGWDCLVKLGVLLSMWVCCGGFGDR